MQITNSHVEETMNLTKLILLLLAAMYLSGCVLTKLITVPMRITGAAISIIPIAGNVVDEVIDEAADVVDKVPI